MTLRYSSFGFLLILGKPKPKPKPKSLSFAPPIRIPKLHSLPHDPTGVNPTSHPLLPTLRCSSGQAAGENATPHDPNSQDQQVQRSSSKGFWSKWMVDGADMRSRVAKLGLAAVLAYGLFDGITYTTFFVLAFLGYEKSTGKNPAANLQALLGIVVLMWTGNNITRPFRVAGAAALAPIIDDGLKRIQKYLNLPNLVYAFALVVLIVAASCFSVVGLMILSRWGK